MIKVGTICMLTGDHSRAGQCCTVTGTSNRRLWRNGEVTTLPVWHYTIELGSGEPPPHRVAWGALPQHLIPIAPPGLTEGEDTRQPVREVA